ncbi:7 transmembrane receptor [Necator americanus]|uniref:7 transmembrane receptor n=1 Tax=Necator americanus TaxID=51031 RepID=W2TVA5_NECAM|nr:7 transmembrane receptor [Necator americanus]ETN84996.1 7 transmembrane receptor [Necator americanus]
MHPQVFFIVVHQSVVMTLATLGNLFLIFVIFRGNHAIRRRISPVQLLLLHTCAADLLFAILTLGTEILTLVSYPKFRGSDWACKAMRYAQVFPLYASPFLLVAISADRYQAICRPLANIRSSRFRRPNCFAAVAWILALLFSIPQLLIWEKKRNGECATFYGNKSHLLKNLYVIGFNTIAWLLPSIFAAFFYYRVCKAVWMSRSKAATLQEANKMEPKKSDVTQDYIDRLRKKSCGHRRQNSEFDRKRVQTVRLTMTIIATNFFLWMPFCVVNMIQAVKPDALSPSLSIYVMILGNLNSCVNPWVYILFNRSQAVKALCARGPLGYSSHRSETDMLSSSRRSECKASVGNSFSPPTSDMKVKVHRNVSFQLPLKQQSFRESSGNSVLLRKRIPSSMYTRETKSTKSKTTATNGYQNVMSVVPSQSSSTPHLPMGTQSTLCISLHFV